MVDREGTLSRVAQRFLVVSLPRGGVCLRALVSAERLSGYVSLHCRGSTPCADHELLSADAWKPVFAATTALTGPETVSKDQALSILHTDDSASLSVESPARSEPPFEPPRSSFSSRDASPTTTYAPSISEATTRIFGSILTSISHASTSTTSFSSSSTQLSRRTRVGEDKSKES